MALKKEERERRKKLLAQGLKYCPSCGRVKPLAEFNKCRTNPDGLDKECRDCSKARSRARNRDGPRRMKRRRRRELRAQGLKDCTRCGEVKPISEFYEKPSSPDGLRGWCKACAAEYHVKYYQDPEGQQVLRRYKRYYQEHHRDKISAYVKQYHAEHRDERLAYKRAWHEANRESENAKARERMKQWTIDNPERYRTQQANRDARMRGAEGSHTEEEWVTLLELCGNKCLCCGATENLTRDHIVPIVRDGSNYIDNIQPLCKSCNSRKGDRHEQDWRPARVKHWALEYIED